MATIYKGFSTIGQTGKFRLTDFDLVKQDIINNFQIRKGEKLMNPDFGTIIWNIIHEPLTEDLKAVIITDIKKIAAYDPRVSIDNVVITEYSQGIQVELQLRYVQTNQVNVMELQFDNETSTLSAV
jgi:phage baseplate assembly protein W|tara:strand:+ start:1187 stop:1564 length:378 start_codon:yes stop_codon:yes gene_type:complete